MTTRVGYSKPEKQLLNAWGDFLDSIDWTSFGTFTSYYSLSKNGARLKMERMTEILKPEQPDIFRMFWVAEAFVSKEYHIHALIKLDHPPIAASAIIINAWHKVCPPAGYKMHNRVLVEEYDQTKGGRFYLAKHINSPNVEYGIY